MQLTPAQIDLLKALRSGAKLHYIRGVNAYFFRDDNFRQCSKQALALLKEGFIEGTSKDSFECDYVLTTKGKVTQ